MTVERRLYVFRVLVRDLRNRLCRSLQTTLEVLLNLIFNRSLIEEVINLHDLVLAIAIDAANALLDTHRIPRQIVVDADMAELEIDSFAAGFRRYEKANLRMIAEKSLTRALS